MQNLILTGNLYYNSNHFHKYNSLKRKEFFYPLRHFFCIRKHGCFQSNIHWNSRNIQSSKYFNRRIKKTKTIFRNSSCQCFGKRIILLFFGQHQTFSMQLALSKINSSSNGNKVRRSTISIWPVNFFAAAFAQ